MCSRQRSQVSWTASSTSSAHSPHRRASHRSSGAYCSLAARHADSSPARIPATSSSRLQAGTNLAAVSDFIVLPFGSAGICEIAGSGSPEPQPSNELRRARRGYRACLSCGMVRQWALSADSPLTPGGRRAMRIRILGPFHVEDGGQQITIGGVRQRQVLADLLLHANEVVPSEQILVDLWGEDTPPSAANALQAAISRLRRVLPPSRLTTMGPGYMLRIFPAELDAAQFEQLIFEGRDALAAGAAAEAVQLLDQAKTLWRGPPLADFRYEPFAQAEIARLEELELACREEWNEAQLALGSPGALIAELGRMVADHPLRERLRGQLMLALYRSGRQTEALEAYREFRKVLAEDLGLEPSSALRELEAAILRQDPVLAPGSATSGPAQARRPVTVLCVALQVAPSSGVTLDPEAHGVLNEHLVSGLMAVLERHGGKLAASDSEHLMGVFGVTTLHEDDALRAVRASLEAREALTAEAGTLPRRYRASLVCRFGLATGEALVGGPGPLGFAGDVGARAVTLAEAARPGEILIGQQTRQLAAGAIETEGVGPDRFLLRSAPPGMRPVPVRLDAPLVGRGEEMGRLEAAYTRAVRERVTMTVTVTGEAGLGKTRLVQEFTGRLGRKAFV